MNRELSRREAIKLGVGLVLAPSLAACSADNSGRYTIATNPAFNEAQKIDQVRKATSGHGETTFQQVSPTSTEIWRPTMAETVRYGASSVLNRVPWLENLSANSAELRLLQGHIYRGEDRNQYRAFIVDAQGNILRILNTNASRAADVFAGNRIDPNFARNAVVRVQFETPFDQNALEVAAKGLEVHLETVDADFPFAHYAYQSTKVTPLKP